VNERSLLRYVRYYASKKVLPGDEDKVKLPIQLSLQDETDFPHTGYIDFLDNRVDPDTGTIRIRGVFDFEKGLLGPGLFVRVRIPAGDAYHAVLVPERSVGSDQGQKFLWSSARTTRLSSGRWNWHCQRQDASDRQAWSPAKKWS
jgi:multidrug efflux pump subunit AcrA (membrane-fusion protein)